MANPLWFGADSCADEIIRIAEVHVDPYAVGDIWLVRGTDLDVAVDAGSGIVAPGPVVDNIVDRPVLCVALTCSYDHAGGWSSFRHRACHQLDVASLAHPVEENEAVSVYLTADRFFAYPEPAWTPADYRMIGAAPTRLLADGDVIDLGNRWLEVLHTPGRSPGGLSLWEAETATLFTGEMLYDGDHGPAWPPEDPWSYCASLRRLSALRAETVHPGHYGSFDGARMATLIDEQLTDLADSGFGSPTPHPS